jgi:hypothetical protein
VGVCLRALPAVGNRQVNGQHLVLPAHTRPDTDRVWEYLQQWVTNLDLTLRVDADSPDLQVVDVMGKDGALDHFEMPLLIGPADGRRIQLDAIVLPPHARRPETRYRRGPEVTTSTTAITSRSLFMTEIDRRFDVRAGGRHPALCGTSVRVVSGPAGQVPRAARRARRRTGPARPCRSSSGPRPPATAGPRRAPRRRR